MASDYPLLRTSPTIYLIANDAADRAAPFCPSTARISSASITLFAGILATSGSCSSRTLPGLGLSLSSHLTAKLRDLHLRFSDRSHFLRHDPSHPVPFQPFLHSGRNSSFEVSARNDSGLCLLGNCGGLFITSGHKYLYRRDRLIICQLNSTLRIDDSRNKLWVLCTRETCSFCTSANANTDDLDLSVLDWKTR